MLSWEGYSLHYFLLETIMILSFLIYLLLCDMQSKPILLKIKDLSRAYPRQSSDKVFEHLSLDLHQGDFCVLMGKSGTGKTTLAKLIIWELPAPATSIYYGSQDISTYTETDMEQYRKKVGIIFQDYKLLEKESVRKNIAYPLEIFWYWSTIVDARLDLCIQKYKLRDIVDAPIASLSSWEKQRVCLARALIHSPEFIIADEPTGNLDRENSQIVADLLLEANKAGNTILLITHDIHLVHYLKHKGPITSYILK